MKRKNGFEEFQAGRRDTDTVRQISIEAPGGKGKRFHASINLGPTIFADLLYKHPASRPQPIDNSRFAKGLKNVFANRRERFVADICSHHISTIGNCRLSPLLG